jgi:hypothetical protein
MTDTEESRFFTFYNSKNYKMRSIDERDVLFCKKTAGTQAKAEYRHELIPIKNY